MKRSPFYKSFKKTIASLTSWVSVNGDEDESFFQPETLIYKKSSAKSVAISKKNKRIAALFVLCFFIICSLLYAGTIKGVAGNPNPSEIKKMDAASFPFELSPERGRYAHTYALAEQGSFSLNQELADVVYPDVGYIDGRFYSFFAPGVSIIAVPFYVLGSFFNLAQVITYSTIAIFALGSMFFLYKIGRDIFRLPVPNALLAPLIFAFGSTSWSYATTMYQHHISTFFIISAFYAVWKFSKGSRYSLMWGAYVWFSYAAAFTVDYPNILFMLPVMIYFFLSSVTLTKIRRKVTFSIRPVFLITAVIFLLITFFHGYYNYTQLGNWKTLSGTIPGYKTIKELALFEKEGGEDLLKELEKDKTSASFFSEENSIRGAYTLLIAPDKGILFFSPIFLLAVAGLITLFKRIDTKRAVLISLAGINLFLYASFGDPWGGWAFGPRYLILSMSVLSLFIALWLSKLKNSLPAKIILTLLFAYSSAISLLGVLTTNAVPPKVEADFLKMKYGYFLNWDFFNDNISSSFVFNEIFSGMITLKQYFIILYILVMFLFLTVLFLTRKAESDEV